MNRRPLFPAAWLAAACLASAGSCTIFRSNPPHYPPVVTASGILVQDLVVPKGTPVERGDRVTLHYEARLDGGEVFDSSYRNGRPAVFRIGDGEVPGGLEEGVVGMVVGGRRELTLPPELAFGAEGVPGRVPPDAVVLFDVELLAVE